METQMKYKELREHLIANNFNPTWQCPLTAKFPISINADGTIGEFPEFQNFLNSHLNSQKFIRLYNVELSTPFVCWGHDNTIKTVIFS
jgi:hypothetical protein